MPPQPLIDNKQGARPRAQLESLQPRKGPQFQDRQRFSSPQSRDNDGIRRSDSSRYEDDAGQRRRSIAFTPNGNDVEGHEGEQHNQRTQRRFSNRSPARSGRNIAGNGGANAMMGSPYGMMPMGGMGYGGMGYGGMGYGMGGMMGGGMMGGMMGPMNMIYSVNYFIAMIGQVTTMLGMSTQAVGHLYHMAREALFKAEQSVRQSEMRRWLQRKSKQSPLLRWLLILTSMLAASQIIRFLRYLIEMQMKRKGWLLGNGSSANAVEGAAGAITAATSIANGQSI